MAKVSLVQRELKRQKLNISLAAKRDKLKRSIYNKNIPLEDRFNLVLKLAKLSRNSSKIRQRNRCKITGRPRSYYRKFALSRNKLRELASSGMLPGLVKSSW